MNDNIATLISRHNRIIYDQLRTVGKNIRQKENKIKTINEVHVIVLQLLLNQIKNIVEGYTLSNNIIQEAALLMKKYVKREKTKEEIEATKGKIKDAINYLTCEGGKCESKKKSNYASAKKAYLNMDKKLRTIERGFRRTKM